MASAKDVKDMLGLAAGDGAPKTTAKKPKAVGHKRLTGINREVLALHGDRAPPVSIIDSTKIFRAKLKRDFRPSKWENMAFTNSARSDGLQLRHWRKQKPQKPANGEAEADAMDIENKDPEAPPDYEFAKYNIGIAVPTYTEEQYNANLHSDDWSREETEYLLDLVKEYYQKWPVIIDRYEYLPSASASNESASRDATALVKAQGATPRTLEQLKARYYEVWAKTLALQAGGMSNMNETEFQLHETLTKYNPQTEAARKHLAWQLTTRSVEEIREEEYLLSELQRIMISAQKFETERAEVRQRLEAAPSHANGNLVPSSFAAYNQLYNQLAAQDRNRKSRHRLSLNANDLVQSPAGIGPNGTPITANSHRDSLGGASGPQKKGSLSIPQPVRQLPRNGEKRFGITTHDRLTSGVAFRSDKLVKLRQAKSQIQTQKIAAALTELSVPDIIQLPTQRVVDAFEALVAKVQKLVDARKVVEKEEAEVRVQGALRDELKKKENGDEATEEDTKMNGVEEQEGEEDKEGEAEDDGEGDEDVDDDVDADEGDGEGEEDAEGEEDDAAAARDEMDVDPTPRPSSSRSLAASSVISGHKRSASVLSTTSNMSKASKRSRRGR